METQENPRKLKKTLLKNKKTFNKIPNSICTTDNDDVIVVDIITTSLSQPKISHYARITLQSGGKIP